jgi:glutamyl-tRNA reductase
VRERFAFTPLEQRAFLAAAVGRAARAGLGELAILSTCNRTELYAAADDVARQFAAVPPELPGLLAGWRNVSLTDVEAHLFGRVGLDAVRHVSRVAAGLDSMIVGESEVLGQVASAHELAAEERAAGPVLAAVFHTAIRAGRRARSETGIGRRPSSVSTAAVAALSERCDLTNARAVIVGTGEAGRLAGDALRKRGVRRLAVVSRTAERAHELARAWDAAALPWHALEAALVEADVVIACTGAPHAVITRELVVSGLRRRPPGRPLLVADIAVPRDVEPAVRELPSVTVIDLDDVQRLVEDNLAVRAGEAAKVEAIVEQEVGRFMTWCRGAALRPVLAALRAHGEAIRQQELDRTLRRLGSVSPELRAQLDALTQGLVNRLLHSPSRRLRDETDPERRERYARAVLELFAVALGTGVDEVA